MRTEIFIEVAGKKTNSKTLIDMAKEIWKSEGKFIKDIKNIDLYFKPEENKCYYVINSEENGYFLV